MDALFSVTEQVVFVSGGTRGIGRALAAGFAARGARVWISGRNGAAAKTAAADIVTSRYPVQGIGCDVAEESQIHQAVAEILRVEGRIDTLINVAGINNRQRAENYSSEVYNDIINTNQRGVFQLAQAVGRHLIERGQGGCLINIGSLNTKAPLKGVLPYAMSKSAVVAMTRGLALEWGPHGIRVNCLDPGFILTDLTQKLWSDPQMQAWGQANTPMQRLGEPEDLVGTAIFLASPAARFVTGQQIYVDGGFTAGYNWPIPLA